MLAHLPPLVHSTCCLAVYLRGLCCCCFWFYLFLLALALFTQFSFSQLKVSFYTFFFIFSFFFCAVAFVFGFHCFVSEQLKFLWANKFSFTTITKKCNKNNNNKTIKKRSQQIHVKREFWKGANWLIVRVQVSERTYVWMYVCVCVRVCLCCLCPA